LVEIKEDGSIWFNQDYFEYATGLRMVKDKNWEKLFGLPRREPETEILQHHCDLALATQKVTEEAMLKMAYEAKRLTNAKYLCMAGGVALNCVANGKILNEKLFEDIFIQPAAGDAGGAVGAALAADFIYFNQERISNSKSDEMKGSFLGPEFSDLDMKFMSRKYDAVYKEFIDFDELIDQVSTLLMDGNAIGWFQGRMEFGPRALGNRSIIGDARNPEMQKKLNVKIKYRESFRPFAPSVLAEDSNHYFKMEGSSPYMLIVENVVEERRTELPPNYHELPLREKLYYARSDIPAITHIDFSARIQTVHKETNERFWKLIRMFQQKTGYGLIINTSFNVRGEPIVCTPEDAYRCFMRTEMDYLVMGDLFYDKKVQPEWEEKDNWKEEFTLD